MTTSSDDHDSAINAPPTLLVFSDDWGRHPSSCQHLIRELLPKFPVIWVNTIGTRKPRLDIATVRRAWEKASHWSRMKGRIGDSHLANLCVASPRMWPWFSHTWDRWLNRRLLVSQLRSTLRGTTGQVVAITTLPIVADLVGNVPVSRWVYYCVDDFSQWPGLDGITLERMERKLVRRVDLVVAAGNELQKRVQGMDCVTRLLTHGVNLRHWRDDAAVTPPTFLHDLQRPLVIFWGLIDRRMDVSFVQELSDRMTSGTIVLIGPKADPDARLERISRVVIRPAAAYAELPAVARAASVLIMPYADLPVTRAMQPLKLKEYLATNRPVVVRNLPAVMEWSDCLDVAGAPGEFADLVLLRLDGMIPVAQQQSRTRLESESWTAKARQLADWLIEPCAVGDHAQNREHSCLT